MVIAREAARVLSSDGLLANLRTVERAVQQNLYHNSHRLYRAIPGAEPMESAAGAAAASAAAGAGAARRLEDELEDEELSKLLGDGARTSAPAEAAPHKERMYRLWSYHCSLTEGRNVAAMAWNRLNPDILAVAYGQFDFGAQRDGLVLFWSLKNPEVRAGVGGAGAQEVPRGAVP